MMLMKLVSVIAVATIASGADRSDEIRSFLRNFNEALRKPEAPYFRTLFTSQADYRDAAGSLKGADAIVSLFKNRQLWSERTPPVLHEEGIKFIGETAAFVDAQIVQYGSTIGKSSVPLVVLLEKEASVWKISSWRMSAHAILLSPP
jgi:hypothetical protein